ncbi:DUF6515 family protein [Aureisphaera sp.]
MKKLVFILSIALLSFSSCATRVVQTTPRSNVVIVQKAPRNHSVVVVKGKRYYEWNGKRYRKTQRGYVLIGM